MTHHYRYIYLGDKYTAPWLKGQECDPVLRADGKCIVGRGTQLVVFADGSRRAVLRRRLRVRDRISESRGKGS